MRNSDPPPSPVVIKVGGSLYDWDQLGPRLTKFLAEWSSSQLVLVPGGGPTADLIRVWDRQHGLGEEAAHWLALRALSMNAWFLMTLLGNAGSMLIGDVAGLPELWRQGKIPVLDAVAFAALDEGRPGCLPHGWDVTSDSLAARVALVCRARKLLLLKSSSLPAGWDWPEAGRQGYVDPFFVSLVDAGRHRELAIEAINFREWEPGQVP